MIIKLIKDISIEISGDNLIIPKGQYTAISKEYISNDIELITYNGNKFNLQDFKLHDYFKKFSIIRYKQHYFVIFSDDYTIPKVVNGWINY
jgi:hypothetical protein